MEEETIYTYILTKTDGTYLGWSKAKEVKTAGDGMTWIEWNKPLPDDIDSREEGYTLEELEELYVKMD